MNIPVEAQELAKKAELGLQSYVSEQGDPVPNM